MRDKKIIPINDFPSDVHALPAASLIDGLIPRIIKLHCMTLGAIPSSDCGEGRF